MLRISVLLCLALLLAPLADAKDKNKVVLTADVLNAQTIRVVIHPESGEPLTDISANRKAREDVERALEKWGRFRLAMESEPADLVFVVRKGTGRMGGPTIKGGPLDNPPSNEDSVHIGIGTRRGNPSDSQGGAGAPQDTSPRVSSEAGPSGDLLEVYRGQGESPLDAPPAWRCTAKDGLRSPTVPAVEEFRKVFDESQKALDQMQKKKP